jgi:vitamin K-dependent gamma-carboxylase
MLLRDKRGDGHFVVTEASGRRWREFSVEYLSERQASKMSTRPDMIVQFAHYLRQRLEDRGHEGVEVRARIKVSLNGRPPRYLFDPAVDLTEVGFPWFGDASWIESMRDPLPHRQSRV